MDEPRAKAAPRPATPKTRGQRQEARRAPEKGERSRSRDRNQKNAVPLSNHLLSTRMRDLVDSFQRGGNDDDDETNAKRRMEKLLQAFRKDTRAEATQEETTVMRQLPQSVRALFGQIGFAKSGREYHPALVLSPFSVPFGTVSRDRWMKLFQKKKAKDLPLGQLMLLVHWYGEESASYTLVSRSAFCPWEEATKGMLDYAKVAAEKLDQGRSLTEEDRRKLRAMVHVSEDQKKAPSERRPPSSTDAEPTGSSSLEPTMNDLVELLSGLSEGKQEAGNEEEPSMSELVAQGSPDEQQQQMRQARADVYRLQRLLNAQEAVVAASLQAITTATSDQAFALKAAIDEQFQREAFDPANHDHLQFVLGFLTKPPPTRETNPNQEDQPALQPEVCKSTTTTTAVAHEGQGQQSARRPDNVDDKETEADVMEQLPQSIRDMFGQIGFAKWNRVHLPVLVVSPFSVPKRERSKWMAMFHKMREKGRPLTKMSFLVYFYAEKDFDLIAHSTFVPYDHANKKMLKYASSAEKKRDTGKALNADDQHRLAAMRQLREDMEKIPSERRPWIKGAPINQTRRLKRSSTGESRESESHPNKRLKPTVVDKDMDTNITVKTEASSDGLVHAESWSTAKVKVEEE